MILSMTVSQNTFYFSGYIMFGACCLSNQQKNQVPDIINYALAPPSTCNIFCNTKKIQLDMSKKVVLYRPLAKYPIFSIVETI
jgi:diphthamide synthase subunit DPH2